MSGSTRAAKLVFSLEPVCFQNNPLARIQYLTGGPLRYSTLLIMFPKLNRHEVTVINNGRSTDVELETARQNV